jgi:hypothetical protein|tara:strand:- start:3395 stop:3769 length:375 start_codon:yes stop_codon:yes gene_type:complete
MPDEKVYTDKQNAFLEALMMKETRGSIRKAMDVAGYSKTTSINSMVESLGTEIHDRANKILQMNAPKAAWGMVDVLDDPSAMGARNSIAAAAQIMDRTGLVKKEQVEVKNTGGAMFILPPKNED